MDKIKIFLIFVIIQLFLIKQQYFFSLIHNLIHHGSLSSFQIILYWASILFNVQHSLIYCLKLMYFFAFFSWKKYINKEEVIVYSIFHWKDKTQWFFFIAEIKTDKFRPITVHIRIQFDVPWGACVPCAQQFRVNQNKLPNYMKSQGR